MQIVSQRPALYNIYFYATLCLSIDMGTKAPASSLIIKCCINLKFIFCLSSFEVNLNFRISCCKHYSLGLFLDFVKHLVNMLFQELYFFVFSCMQFLKFDYSLD